MNPFSGAAPKGTESFLSPILQPIDRLNGDLFEFSLANFTWDFYFTLDQVLERQVDLPRGRFNCRIGQVSCTIPPGPDGVRERIRPEDPKDIVRRESPAGVWTSRPLADSSEGRIYMCHTLQPNVSVNFATRRGSSIGVRFDSEYKKYSQFWFVYVHDPRESVTALTTMVLDSQAYISLKKQEDGKSGDPLAFKHKALVIPTK